MKSISKDELIGEFERNYSDQVKVKDLKSQASEISKEISANIKGFAKEIEADEKQVRAAYKRFCELKNGGDVEAEDFYLMVSAIDEYFAEESED